MSSRPLQNRVMPTGQIIAVAQRGTMMGNRGGRLHDDHKRLKKNWASKQWISCVTTFKGRQRQVMGNSYTELFFLDEATALAAGHRPCFECRRADANRFAEIWADCLGRTERLRAPHMDQILHPERTGPKHMAPANSLPDGAFFLSAGEIFLQSKDGCKPWSFSGYGRPQNISGEVEILTPPSICKILHAGYQPQLHPSAD